MVCTRVTCTCSHDYRLQHTYVVIHVRVSYVFKLCILDGIKYKNAGKFGQKFQLPPYLSIRHVSVEHLHLGVDVISLL